METRVKLKQQWALIYVEGQDVIIEGDFGTQDPELIAKLFSDAIFEKFRHDVGVN